MKKLLTMKKRIFLLFLSIMMLCMANVPLYAAAIIPDGVIFEENLRGKEELMPMVASECVVYQTHHISLKGNIPNATYYWTSNGQTNGTIFSIAYMDSWGRTTYRNDLIAYNNNPDFGHGIVDGPHQHSYVWSIYVAEDGTIYHNKVDESINSLSNE